MGQLHRLYRRWIWANAWSEFVGLGGTFVLGWLLFSQLSQASLLVTLGGALFAVAAGAFLEGAVVGYAQGTVLLRQIPGFQRRRWIAATVVGAGVAWLLGMLPSTVMALSGAQEAAAPAAGPEGVTALALAAGLGLVLGPVLSTPQFIVLRTHVTKAWIWIPANAVAWAGGMVVVFAGAGSLSTTSTPLQIALTVGIACLAAGITVGIVHGWWLVRLLGHPSGSDPANIS